MKIWSRRLVERREAVGLSQGQVGLLEEISPQYLSKLENGVNDPAVWALLRRLARRYRTTSDYLLGLTDAPNPAAEQIFIGLDHATVAALQSLIDELRPLTPTQRQRVLAATKTIRDLYEPNIIGGRGEDQSEEPNQASE